VSATAALPGQVCVVTGASTGIGQAIARGLAGAGAVVVGFARRFPAAGLADCVPAAAAGRVAEVKLDVTDETQVAARFREVVFALGPIAALVHSAGIGVFAPFGEARADDLRAMLDVHVVGAFLCARAALESMRAAGRGHIVHIGSIAARETFPECAGYSAAKAGQAGLTRVLAHEARAWNVRVTSVLPGAVDTPIWDSRPGFDRKKMMRADELAGLVIDLLTRPGLAVEEIAVLPPGGSL
jgi:NAD(P)-dependent dehydrogenase (short-subunit alcohol dehydrogenase family)